MPLAIGPTSMFNIIIWNLKKVETENLSGIFLHGQYTKESIGCRELLDQDGLMKHGHHIPCKNSSFKMHLNRAIENTSNLPSFFIIAIFMQCYTFYISIKLLQ